MNRIIIDDKFNKIVELWSMSAKNTNIDRLPFDEVELVENHNDKELITIVKSDRIIQKIDGRKIVVKYEFKNGIMEFVRVTFTTIDDDLLSQLVKKTLANLGYIFAFIMNYNFEENKEAKSQLAIYKFITGDIKISQPKSNRSLSTEKIKTYSTENIFTTLVNINPVKKSDLNSSNTRKYERHTESWEVRGYYRTYKKTGKRIWVDAFPKGKKRNVKEKIYKI